MATATYMLGRKKYNRPQAMLWAENSGTLTPDKTYVPNGFEVGGDPGSSTDSSLLNNFLILSDDNRSPINFNTNRIEKRERMINGRMRSYHIADKLSISTSWDMLPSRSFYTLPNFNPTTGISTSGGFGLPSQLDEQYTTDGGAGGADMLDWYENHKGSFWVYLAYDKRTNFGDDANSYLHLHQYNQLVEMFISDFQYTVVKRGSTKLVGSDGISGYDFWNISVTLEEV